ncbi:hypothetical protein TRFO_15458 [Tritrichomonas foetus]|uniref:Uncharacterized protein n=1 Tax=Tritrichomonas foetus TaxID=1144522 RepID=A0A1J4KX46_9EUKA|nr:hypothetical protein TRFO_15458 [Tritrichomonas foetus]|eukprot:OHT14278.1 hypothetical protein TRFO_15458 [Tritrichomonas foetus]
MFCNINSVPLSVVNSVPSLLSAAEMLEDSFPDVSGSFITYAFMLCDDYFSKNETNAEIDDSFSELKDLSTISTACSAKELEQFGDSILAASEDSQHPQEMNRLAYLAYAATSIHGAPSKRISQKMKRIESKIDPSQNTNQNTGNDSYNSRPVFPVYPTEGIQYFDPHGNVPSKPQYASSDAANVQNYQKAQPSSFHYQSPDQISPQNSHQNYNQQHQTVDYGQVNSSGHDEQQQDILCEPVEVKPHVRSKCEELVEISRLAFKNGSFPVAYAALTMAIAEVDMMKK